MKWFDSPSEVPVSRAILQDDLEQQWPDKQFAVRIHRPGRRSPFQYTIDWNGGPTNEEVYRHIKMRFAGANAFTMDLARTTAHEGGKLESA